MLQLSADTGSLPVTLLDRGFRLDEHTANYLLGIDTSDQRLDGICRTLPTSQILPLMDEASQSAARKIAARLGKADGPTWVQITGPDAALLDQLAAYRAAVAGRSGCCVDGGGWLAIPFPTKSADACRGLVCKDRFWRLRTVIA
jgi:hypothetical protein